MSLLNKLRESDAKVLPITMYLEKYGSHMMETICYQSDGDIFLFYYAGLGEPDHTRTVAKWKIKLKNSI